MQRYFIDEVIDGEEVAIHGDDARHMTRVMRMRPGNSIICCGSDGRCAVCKIQELSTDEVTASVENPLDTSAEMPVSVTIAQGLPKGEKLDLTVQKGTEFGACDFLPFEADRSIVNWDDKKKSKKTARLQKIAKEAAEQAHRNRVPEVSTPVSFQEILDQSKDFDVKIVPYEEEATNEGTSKLKKVVQSLNIGDSLLVVIGPEGGLAEHEVSALKDHGFTACGLGPRILRTETAELYILAAISYQFE